MSKLYKALCRPAMLFGAPVTLVVVVAFFLFLLGVYLDKGVWLLIPLVVYGLGVPTRKDEHYYSLLYIKLRTALNIRSSRYFKSPSIQACHYDPVDVQEFVNQMKLNDRTPFEKIIPYSTILTDDIVKTRDGDLISTWQLLGDTFEFDSVESLANSANSINTLLKGFSGYPLTFYVHSVRENFYDCFDSASGNAFADRVSELYYQGIKDHTFKSNILYFSVAYRPFNLLDKSENRGLSLEQKKQQLLSSIAEMEEIRGRLFAALYKYSARPLGRFESKGVVYSNQVSFYNFLVSGVRQPVRVGTSPLYELIGGGDVYFGRDTGQITVRGGNRFFRSLEIKEFSSREINAGILDILLYADIEYVMTQSFTLMSKSEALKHIKSLEKQLKSIEDDAVSQREDLERAKDELTSGEISFGKYHFTLFVYADKYEALVKDTNALAASFTDLGLIVTLSTLSLAPAFCAQLPGVYHLRPRLAAISSANFSELASFHNFYTGKRDNTCWGEAISILKTPGKQAYYLNLHNVDFYKSDFGEKSLANTSVIGTAGAGKTMLLSFLAIMLQKYNRVDSFSESAQSKKMTLVFLDKDRGAELNIRALGGEYFSVKSGESTGWNPFYLPKSRRNSAFIKSLIKLLVTRNGESISSREETLISKSVDAVLDMEPLDNRQHGITRMLEHMSEATTELERKNGLVVRLAHWAQGGQFGWVFDNAEDSFDITQSSIFGVDGTEFLDDRDTCTPIAFYLLFRITQLLDGRRMVIFLDEFWKWLGDVAFKDFVYNKLKTIRKLNGLVIPATQSPDEILKSDISRAVVEVCGTQIFMANPQADYDDYVHGFKITPQAFAIIKSLDPASRQFVIKKSSFKKGDEKSFYALVTLDLTGLGKYTKVLSSSADNLEVFDSLFKDRMLPDEWLGSYLELSV